MGALRRGVRGSARESLQVRYGALQALYYFGTCALGGFAAIFLGYKGLSNSLIGVATGASCILSVVLMPAISMLLERKPGLGIPRVARSLTLGSVACYVVLALAPLPTYAVIVLFALANAMSLAIAPFLSQLAMGFNRIGMPINFGLARGMGSVSYAVGAVGLSRLVELSSPGVLAGLFVLSGVVLLAVLASMPTCEAPVKAGAVQAEEPRSQADQTLGSTGRAPAACDSAEGMATAAGTVVDAPAGDALGATAGDALDATTGGAPDAPAGDAPGELDASHGAKGRHEDERGGAFREILRERVLLMVLAGFMVAFIACNCLSVYLIDIVVNVGGDTSMYGVAIFLHGGERAARYGAGAPPAPSVFDGNAVHGGGGGISAAQHDRGLRDQRPHGVHRPALSVHKLWSAHAAADMLHSRGLQPAKRDARADLALGGNHGCGSDGGHGVRRRVAGYVRHTGDVVVRGGRDRSRGVHVLCSGGARTPGRDCASRRGCASSRGCAPRRDCMPRRACASRRGCASRRARSSRRVRALKRGCATWGSGVAP